MSTPVISLRGVGKRYIKYSDQPMLMTAALRWRQRTKRSELWAVRDVDFDVDEGESIGILGRNGAGKSTMLQMLAGVTAPSSGVVHVDGRVSPLISVGVGFHPELTGRENVYVNGTILGMPRKTIERRFDEIVAFAELENFIDTPVKFYSSGMFVRLGFSVAIEADPDILLVDEILAVGDFAFQLKCYERMQKIRERGTTVVVVSHNLGGLRTFCDRGIVFDHGRVVHDGSMFDAIGSYHQLLAVSEADASGDPTEQRQELGSVEIIESRLVDADGSPAAHVNAGDTLVVRATIRAGRDIERPFSGIIVSTDDRDICVYSDSNRNQPHPPLRAGEVQTYEARIPANFPTGSYTVKMSFHRHVDDYRTVPLGRTPPVSFYTTGRPLVGGLADLAAAFTATSATG
ncbi:MAG: lipopolysaccharide transport system ATP-binding protein [Frankiaceae bacterium]|nr:lipopolysaccharide transport system ATP-binding protein [Frankiaceae bacterium]